MKKIINVCFVALLVLFFNIQGTSASSFSFDRDNVKADAGDTFKIVLSINPAGNVIYTVKSRLTYQADFLEIVSFDFAKDWMRVAAPGYDFINNKNGELVKTAGIAGGVSEKKVFGYIIFRAKKSGVGSVTLDNDSFSLDSGNKNTLSNFSSVKIEVLNKKVFKNQEVGDEKTVSPSPSIDNDFKTNIFLKNFKTENSGDTLLALQTCLKEEGVYSGAVDGEYNIDIKKAIKLFQEKYKKEILDQFGLEKGTGVLGGATLEQLNKVCVKDPEVKEVEIVESDLIPDNLFDINLEIDEHLVRDSDEVVSRVILNNFGKEATGIRLTFSILDLKNNVVYEKKEFLIVETEEIFTKRFPKLDLSPGRYVVRLETVYGDDVRDDFSSVFGVVGVVDSEWVVYRYLGFLSFVLAILVFVGFVVVEFLRYRKRGVLKAFIEKRKKVARLKKFKNRIKKIFKK